MADTIKDQNTHVFESTLETFKTCTEWIKENKTSEQYEAWTKRLDSGENNEDMVELYREWLVDQKITHTIINSEGEKQINSHTDEHLN